MQFNSFAVSRLLPNGFSMTTRAHGRSSASTVFGVSPLLDKCSIVVSKTLGGMAR
jgi:hypothetical protein